MGPSRLGMTIAEYMATDHRRLEALLEAAQRCEPVALGPYTEFRRGLLRHIAIEEKVLLVGAQQARGGVPIEIAIRLRLDHGAIAALLVPTPTPDITATLRHILARHNLLEEGDGGMYAECDLVLAPSLATIMVEMEGYSSVNMSAHNDAPGVMPAVERALERAGYRLVR